MRGRYVLASGLALAYSLALLGDSMMYVFLPSHPGAAGIAAASLGIVLSANPSESAPLASFVRNRDFAREAMIDAFEQAGQRLANELLYARSAGR